MPENEPTGEIQLFHNFPRILYVSFYLSQGNSDTQLYLLEEYLQDYPSERPRIETQQHLLSTCTNFLLMKSPVLRKIHHPFSLGGSDKNRPNPQKPLTINERSMVQESVQGVLDGLIQSGIELKGISDLGRSFAIEGMLMKDKKTLNAIGERNNKDIKLPTSYYLTYCLNKQKTGIAAFDRAFEKMYLDIQEAKNDQNSPLHRCIETFLLTVKESSGILTQAEKQALIDSLEKSPTD